MFEAAEYYTTDMVADLLGVTYNSARMKIRRGVFPPFAIGGRIYGVLEKDFWAVCEKQEKVGLIREKNMPRVYQTERKRFLGDVHYEELVLRGRHSQ